jgi:4-amino-4-deoxy-L-arabinose transferase-like glycosyltransferase
VSSDEGPWSDAHQRPARWGWPDLAILTVGGLLLFTALGTRSLWHSEGRWAEITREMFLTGDFFHPTIGGEPYFDKPLLTYWLVAAAAAISGKLDEWAARFPSALAGLTAVAATLWLGRRLWSAQTGRIAAAILLTTYGLLFWSRTADADIENLAAVMLALAWYWSRRDRAKFADYLVFYLIVFVGALMKGLPAVILPILAILPDVAMNRRWRQVLTPGHLLAALLASTAYLAPFIYASSSETGAYDANGLVLVFRENIVRFFQPFDHTGPVYLYLYYLPALLMPWAPLFIAAVVGLVGRWKDLDEKTKWLLWASVVIFVFFTASGSRRGYYILPLLPFSALLVGVFLDRSGDVWFESVRRHGLRVQAAVIAVVVLGELLGPAIGVIVQRRLGDSLPVLFYVALPATAVAAAVAAFLLWRLGKHPANLRHRGWWAMLGAAAVLMGGFFCWQQNTLEKFRTERPFALELRAKASGLPPEDVAFYRNNAANMLFYMGAERPLPVLRNAEELRAFVAGGEKRAVISRRKFVADACAAAPGKLRADPDLVEASPQWSTDAEDGGWVAWIVAPDHHQAATRGQEPERRDEK